VAFRALPMSRTIDPALVRARLDDIVSGMKGAGIWDVARPADAAFVDMGPFGSRTMSIEQWLRWVFVPNVEQRLASNGPWPDRSSVGVAATREGGPVSELASPLSAFDELFRDPAEPWPPTPSTLPESPDKQEKDLVDRGDALIDEGHDDEALAFMEQATNDEHLAASAHSWLSWFFAQKRPDIPRAIQHGQKAVELRPAWGFAHLNLAWAHEEAAHWADAYRSYLDALACGNSQDEVFVETRASKLAARATARGEAVPSLIAGSPAHGRIAKIERVMRAIVIELAAMSDMSTHAWVAAVGVPVPEGDVPFGWIGTTAGGRAYVHALISDLSIFSTVEVLTRSHRLLVLRSHQVRTTYGPDGVDVLTAALAIAEWVRSGALSDPRSGHSLRDVGPPTAGPQSLTPFDAAALARTALFEALPGNRFRLAGGAEYYAPNRPAAAYVVPRKYPELPRDQSLWFEMRWAGGVRVHLMADRPKVRGQVVEVATYADLVAMMPRIVESTSRALEALGASRNG
jgi:uncharacterized protein YqcC (DUF446 family)